MTSREDEKPPYRFVGLVAVVLLMLFAGFVVLLWRLGLFDVHSGKTDAQVIAAALSLVGALLAASLTFIGVLLKHSIDERTLKQARETEGRLRLETSIQAVQLLTEEGKVALPTRQAGALFALASLGQRDFALALLREIWKNGEVSPSAALWVVNDCLVHGNEDVQAEAAGLLERHAPDLVTGAGAETTLSFPDCMTDCKWPHELPQLARERLFTAFMTAVVSRPNDEWPIVKVADFIAELDLIRKTDPASHIKCGALWFLLPLLEQNSAKPDAEQLAAISRPDGSGWLDVIELGVEVNEIVSGITEGDLALSAVELTERLRAGGGVDPTVGVSADGDPISGDPQ